MDNMNNIAETLIENSTIVKKRGLSQSDVEVFIREYQEAVNQTLLDYGYAQVSEDFRLEIVKLQKRKHVLRGQSYYNHRRYKVKAKVSYTYYERLAEVFKEFLDEDGEENE